MVRLALGSSTLLFLVIACTAGGPDSTGTTSSSSGGSSGGSSSGGSSSGGSSSGSSGGSGCGGVSTSTTMAAATSADRATLCDCTAEREGGYGKSFPCDGGVTVTNKKDQAACLASWPACTNATVGDLIACTDAIVEHDRCDINAAIADSRCAWLTSCQK